MEEFNCYDSHHSRYITIRSWHFVIYDHRSVVMYNWRKTWVLVTTHFVEVFPKEDFLLWIFLPFFEFFAFVMARMSDFMLNLCYIGVSSFSVFCLGLTSISYSFMIEVSCLPYETWGASNLRIFLCMLLLIRLLQFP